MKSIPRVTPWLVAAILIGPSTIFAQCTLPPPEPISLSWPPFAFVQVIPDPSSFNAAQSAMNNWNAATASYCNAPYFSFLALGGSQTMTVNYVAIPPDPITKPRARQNQLRTAETETASSTRGTLSSLRCVYGSTQTTMA